MNKIKFLSILAIGLLISNLMLIGYVVYNKTDRPYKNNKNRQPGPRNIVIEKLHFTEAQITQYDELIQWHRSEINKAQGELMRCKNRLYVTLAENSTDSTLKNKCFEDIAAAQRNIELINYKHFEDIKKLCTSEQGQYYELLTQEIAELFAPHRPKRP
jgi:hypothetical protein